MSDVYRNPQTTPQDERLESRNTDMQDWGGVRAEPAGPAGNTTLINGNEKGILEVGVFRALETHQSSPLGDTHKQYREGIYADSNSDR